MLGLMMIKKSDYMHESCPPSDFDIFYGIPQRRCQSYQKRRVLQRTCVTDSDFTKTPLCGSLFPVVLLQEPCTVRR